MDKWANKVVVVTGASKGIGRAIAQSLASHGMKVIAAARSMDELQALAKEMKDCKGSIEPFQCDLGKIEDICKLFQHVEQNYKALHACINNAGFAVLDYFLPPAKSDGTYDASRNEKDKCQMYKDWQRILNIDVLSLAICSKEAINLMAKTGVKDGLIINVSSIVGQQVFLMKQDNGFYNHMYNAVKFAVTTITADLRLEVQQHDYACGTRIMTLYPGVIKTKFMDAYVGDKAARIILYDKLSYATPEQVAQAVLVAFESDPNIQISGLTIEPTRDPAKLLFPNNFYGEI